MKDKITSYTLYRWRYVLGYIIGGAVIASILILNLLYTPGGIRTAEQVSSVASGALSFSNFDPNTIVNLPYHVLQRASFALFGVTTLSIKLPSILLGVVAIIGCYFLCAAWFRRNTAIITSIIAATLPAMLFISQDGTANIYGVAVSIWLLYVATCVSRKASPAKFWGVLFFVLLALNIYAPLGIWLNIAILTTVFFHPHIRYQARHFNINLLAAACAVSFITLTPLIYSLTIKPQLALSLSGIPTVLPDISHNLHLLATYYLDNEPNVVTPFLEPLFPISAMLLIIIGFYRFILVKYTARSYVVWLWGIIILPMIVLNPESFMVIIPLAILMLAMAIASLIREWYVLFPRNPYARIAGLIPLGAIVFGIAITNTYHFTAGYRYSPYVARAFTDDISSLNQTLSRTTASKEHQVSVLVPSDQQKFYELVARYDKRFTVYTEPSLPTKDIFIIHGERRRAGAMPQTVPSYIAVNNRSIDADRFYLYTETPK